MMPKRRVIFDTTVINRLEDAGQGSEALIRGLELGYAICLTAMCADEIVAIAKNPARREALLRRFAQLLSNARCIWPPNEVVRMHVLAYHYDRRRYHWGGVDVRATVYENAIPRRAFPEEISVEQRKMQFDLHEQFEQIWTALRPKLDQIIQADPSQRLNNFAEAAQACTKPGGVLWGFGAGLYSHALRPEIVEPSDDEIREFIDACPPFRAACYAMVIAWYNFSLRSPHDSTPSAGRNDLMMAAYLPYCDLFLSERYLNPILYGCRD